MNVLIVDDDRTLVDLLVFTFRRDGFDIFKAYNTADALKIFHEQPVDFVVLDVNLPGEKGLKDGFDVCRAIRQESTTPIILLTVRDDEIDIIKGLELGADDYLTKPFSPRQLIARVHSILRRASIVSSEQQSTYKHSGIEFYPDRRELIRSDQSQLLLTRLESRLMTYFMSNPGQILSTDNIIDYVWGPGRGSSEMVRQLVKRLRIKIELDPKNPLLIINFPGLGYRFSK
jgi:DNA-binding response OmpR family regulator